MVQLTAQQIDEYLNVHIPYRLRILVALPRAARKHLTSDQAVFEACFIASLVTARVLLNVVGIGKDQKTGLLQLYTSRYGCCRNASRRQDGGRGRAATGGEGSAAELPEDG